MDFYWIVLLLSSLLAAVAEDTGFATAAAVSFPSSDLAWHLSVLLSSIKTTVCRC